MKLIVLCKIALFCLIVLTFAPWSANAQNLGVPRAPILVLDRDLLYLQSAFGQRILSDIEAASDALRSENRRIDAELTEEEGRLTELRGTIPEADFQVLAEEFDTRVEGIRRAQEVKATALTGQAEQAQQRFFQVAAPVLEQLARESGALVILDRRSVIAAADQIDITPQAIQRIDALLGRGESLDELTERVPLSQAPDAVPVPLPQSDSTNVGAPQ